MASLAILSDYGELDSTEQAIACMTFEGFSLWKIPHWCLSNQPNACKTLVNQEMPPLSQLPFERLSNCQAKNENVLKSVTNWWPCLQGVIGTLETANPNYVANS